MSIEAMSWAFKRELKPSTLKFLLVSLADFSNTEGMAWPSVDLLVQRTCQNRKTVLNGIKELEKRGFLVDSNQRRGKTNQVKVYHFRNPDDNSIFQQIEPKTVLLKNPENGGVTVPKTDSNSTENGNPPAPPILKNLKGTVKGTVNRRNANNMSLADWEAKQGSELCVQMLASWIKDARADAKLLPPLIEEFREKVSAQGREYADFKSAFLVWLRSGWLKKSLMDIRQKAQREISGDAEFKTLGSNL